MFKKYLRVFYLLPFLTTFAYASQETSPYYIEIRPSIMSESNVDSPNYTSSDLITEIHLGIPILNDFLVELGVMAVLSEIVLNVNVLYKTSWISFMEESGSVYTNTAHILFFCLDRSLSRALLLNWV